MFTLYYDGEEVCGGLSLEQAIGVCEKLASRYDYFQIKGDSGDWHKWDYHTKLFVPDGDE